MNSFWNLTGYEYKKILRKKSAIVILVLAIAVAALCNYGTVIGYEYVNGQPSVSKMQSMKIDRAYTKALSGRALDSELMMETAEAYAKVPVDGKYTDTEEYQTYARPYSQIYGIMRVVMNDSADKFAVTDLQDLTQEQADSFYSKRNEKLERTINEMAIGDASKEKLLEMSEKVKTPYVIEYADGYTRFFTILYTIGILASFVTAILLSPMFAGEYTSGADQLILTSKHGKNLLIRSKLFVAMTFSAGLCLFFMLMTYLQCMLMYGFNGANAQIQLYLPLSVYPLTMGQVGIIFAVCFLFANLMVTALTVLLSAKMKSPFGVIIIIAALIIVPMFISSSDNSALLNNLLCLLPTNMMALWNVLSSFMFEFFGASVEPYIIMPIFAAAIVSVSLPFAYRIFKNHQIA